jgi:uncharacterized membrane protein SpoIIM required for sporulation
MKEITFINQNKNRWTAFEEQIRRSKSFTPDDLANHYIQLTDDLSYARTFYPQSGVVRYLNELSARAHATIYRSKKEKGTRFYEFWIKELPLSVYSARRDFIWSLIVFLGACIIGVVSVYSDEGIVRLILGDGYVNMTLDNIERGDPMGVYGTMSPLLMFLAITGNNLYVAFLIFLFGMLTPLGTAIFLIRNGIMVGAFVSFFFQRSLGLEASLAIMIHGTLELSALVLGGGAGFLLGRSILFPGTLPRKDSFIRGVRQGARIMLGLVPFFILASILESYITRHYSTIPLSLNLIIILGSIFFIVWYFVIFPKKVYTQTPKKLNHGKT